MNKGIIKPIEGQDTTAVGNNYLHYDPSRVDYSISDQELLEIEACSGNLWKDVCLVTLGIGIPSLCNACSIYFEDKPAGGQSYTPTMPFFLNSLFGVVCIIFALIFGIAWYNTKKKVGSVVERIRNKPKLMLTTAPGAGKAPE